MGELMTPMVRRTVLTVALVGASMHVGRCRVVLHETLIVEERVGACLADSLQGRERITVTVPFSLGRTTRAGSNLRKRVCRNVNYLQ